MTRSSMVLCLLTIAAISTSAAAFGLAGYREYPTLTAEENLKANFRHDSYHLADVTAVKVHDAWKWANKMRMLSRYALLHRPSRVVEVTGVELSEGAIKFSLLAEDGRQGYLTAAFMGNGAVQVRTGLGDAEAGKGAVPLVREDGGFRGHVGAADGTSLVIFEKPFGFKISRGRSVLTMTELAFGEGLCRHEYGLVEGEVILGGGEQYGWWNHVGRVVINDTDDAYQTRSGNTYIPVPMFVSNQGYGLLLNSHERARFDFGASRPGAARFENPNSRMEYWLFLDPEPARIVMAQSEVVGRAPQLPRWTLEPWISRRTWLGWGRDEGAEADVDRMISEGFPLGVIMYENMTMGDERGIDMRVNRLDKPRMPEIIDKWHAMGIKVVGYHRAAMFRNQPENLAHYGFDQHPEYIVRNPDGSFYVGGIGGDKVYLDVTNPAALDHAWQAAFSRLFESEDGGGSSFERLNLDGVKIDFGEFFPPDEVPVVMRDPKPGMRLYHPTFFSEWLYEKIDHAKPDGGITWVRGCGLGAQRTGIVWAGDRGRTFAQFRATVLAGLHAAMSGVSVWGTDLGGYTGGGVTAEEVYNRAVAFSCFSPTFHDHGSALAPWEQTEFGKDIYRFYARLRYNLVPYVYAQVSEARRGGMPVIRPMPMACAGDPVCWEIDDQYMLGPDLLVAPVLDFTRSRRVYLPAGDWLDFFTREKYSGPGWIEYATPRQVIPVLARDNSIIPVELPPSLEPGGAFDQADKDKLAPGFLVYGGDDFAASGSWAARDPRRTEEVEVSVEVERKAGVISVRAIHPSDAALVVYGDRPAAVVSGAELGEVACSELSDKSWCYREADRATLIIP